MKLGDLKVGERGYLHGSGDFTVVMQYKNNTIVELTDGRVVVFFNYLECQPRLRLRDLRVGDRFRRNGVEYTKMEPGIGCCNAVTDKFVAVCLVESVEVEPL
jgi:hypothetical protein